MLIAKKNDMLKGLAKLVIFWAVCLTGSFANVLYEDRTSLKNASIEISRLQADNQALDRQNNSLQQYVPTSEPQDSLRRRTLKLADELTDFAIKNQEASPPIAIPDSREPNPSEEKKVAMKKYHDYWDSVEKLYMRKYKERTVGIIREYTARGVLTGFLENDFAQRPPYVQALTGEGTLGDDLFWLRQLAYRVDAKDNVIHLDY